ncbi:UNVERIFIED_CONTAM: hypothetical protein GTU68_009948 [Idotea baltica]|nr:hypothetical protein [Idotea baltica]
MLLSLVSCNPKTAESQVKEHSQTVTEDKSPLYTSPKDLAAYDVAYFASGCFWCVEAVYESINGVEEAISGYAGGHTAYPTYKSIGTGRTGHAETVAVYYDPKIVSYSDLVRAFFGSGDPTTPNRQGPDRGSQYRSIAFYETEEQKQIVEDYITQLTAEKVFKRPIITEVTSFKKFFPAEEYHQDFERRNPNQSYVQAVSIPRLRKFQAKFPELLKKEG